MDLPGSGRAWLVTRYEDVRAALADPRLAKDPRKQYPGWTPGPLQAMLSLHMLNLDPPDRDSLRAWTSVLISGDHGAKPRAGPRTGTPRAAMFGYFTRLIAAKRDSPADDLLSALILARDGGDSGDALTEDELYSMVFLLLVAGFETTVDLIASGTVALLTFPREMARLRADPSLLPAAVEELLRYAQPAQPRHRAVHRGGPPRRGRGHPGRRVGDPRDELGEPGLRPVRRTRTGWT